MTIPSYDLLDIIKLIRNNKRFILGVSLVLMCLGTVFFLIKKKKYKSSCVFLINSPLYSDRTSLFRNYETRYVDFFGGEDDVDRIFAMFVSDTVRQRILRECQFSTIYNNDVNNPTGNRFLLNVLKKNLDIKRSQYRELTVHYTAYDSITAANVANSTVQILEETYRNYYVATKLQMAGAIRKQVLVMDSTIAILTDSLANMRDRSGIYNILNPARQTINTDVKVSGKGYGRAIEELQNIESMKDQYVMDRAHYISALNEFEASARPEMNFVKVTSRAIPNGKSVSLDLPTILLSTFLIGIFFTTAFLLVRDYYIRLRNSVNNAIAAKG